jgi:hypothetical protein
MELVTGFAGQAHVDPIDMAHLNAVAFGHDAYLLDTQNKLEQTLETANKLVVDTGDLMIQGHHFTVVQSEEIALQSGVSGQKRNALVCARYEKAEGTDVESASWIVKYGTATTGTPADPSVTTGNILDGVDSVHEEPIFRIEYDGITPGDPILLVPEFQSNAKFRDSISPIVLFDNDDNPVNDDVVLSDSAANYSLLVIEGKDLDGFYCYAMAFDPDGKTVVLETTRCTSATWFHLNSQCVAISGNTIKTSKVNNSSWGETAQINLTGNNIANHINVITITKVLGFK